MERFKYLKRNKLNNLPRASGVYALNSPKQILYIGKAKNIKERVRNHFPASPDSRRASRGGQQPSYRDSLFIDQVTRVGHIKTDSEIDALLLESQLIKTKQPKYNVLWKDDKGYFFVRITKDKLPRIFLTHQPVLPKQSLSKDQYIGPFTEGKAIKGVLRLLRRVFPYYTTKKHGPIPCSWCHLNLCPGPSPNVAQYRKNLKKLASVLRGKKTKVLRNLEKEMKTASEEQNYERASELRDQVFALERIFSHAKLFAPLSDSLFQWNEAEKELRKLVLSKRKIQRIEAFDISNIQGKEATGSQVTFLKGMPAKEDYRKYKIRISGKSNDFAMMQELVTRRLQHPEWPYPELMLIDGGKPQLSAALKAVSSFKNKSRSIKIVALAKKRNELFFPGKRNAILLRDLPRSVELFFLRIRDEAHRFAITYHRTLRSKNLLSS